jgi:hypothetical protein
MDWEKSSLSRQKIQLSRDIFGSHIPPHHRDEALVELRGVGRFQLADPGTQHLRTEDETISLLDGCGDLLHPFGGGGMSLMSSRGCRSCSVKAFCSRCTNSLSYREYEMKTSGMGPPVRGAW